MRVETDRPSCPPRAGANAKRWRRPKEAGGPAEGTPARAERPSAEHPKRTRAAPASAPAKRDPSSGRSAKHFGPKMARVRSREAGPFIGQKCEALRPGNGKARRSGGSVRRALPSCPPRRLGLLDRTPQCASPSDRDGNPAGPSGQWADRPIFSTDGTPVLRLEKRLACARSEPYHRHAQYVDNRAALIGPGRPRCCVGESGGGCRRAARRPLGRHPLAVARREAKCRRERARARERPPCRVGARAHARLLPHRRRARTVALPRRDPGGGRAGGGGGARRHRLGRARARRRTARPQRFARVAARARAALRGRAGPGPERPRALRRARPHGRLARARGRRASARRLARDGDGGRLRVASLRARRQPARRAGRARGRVLPGAAHVQRGRSRARPPRRRRGARRARAERAVRGRAERACARSAARAYRPAADDGARPGGRARRGGRAGAGAPATPTRPRCASSRATSSSSPPPPAAARTRRSARAARRRPGSPATSSSRARRSRSRMRARIRACGRSTPILAGGNAGYLGVPLAGTEGSPRGVLAVYSEQPRAWREEEIDALLALAASTSAALANAELYQRVALERERQRRHPREHRRRDRRRRPRGQRRALERRRGEDHGRSGRRCSGAYTVRGAAARASRRTTRRHGRPARSRHARPRGGLAVGQRGGDARPDRRRRGPHLRVPRHLRRPARRADEVRLRVAPSRTSSARRSRRSTASPRRSFARTCCSATRSAQTFLGYIASESQRLTQIVDALLNVARLDTGDLQVRLAPTDVREVLGDAVSQRRERRAKRPPSSSSSCRRSRSPRTPTRRSCGRCSRSCSTTRSATRRRRHGARRGRAEGGHGRADRRRRGDRDPAVRPGADLPEVLPGRRRRGSRRRGRHRARVVHRPRPRDRDGWEDLGHVARRRGTLDVRNRATAGGTAVGRPDDARARDRRRGADPPALPRQPRGRGDGRARGGGRPERPRARARRSGPTSCSST